MGPVAVKAIRCRLIILFRLSRAIDVKIFSEIAVLWQSGMYTLLDATIVDMYMM